IGWFSDVHIWGRAYFSGLPLWGFVSAAIAVTIVIPVFGLVALSFVPMGQLVGTYLENTKHGVAAYSINVAASIVGIWFVTLLSWMSASPEVCFLLLFVGLLLFFARPAAVRRSLLITAVILSVLFAMGTTKRTWWGEESWKGARDEQLSLQPGDPQVLWSPYQKLTVVPLLDNGRVSRIILSTNDLWYQQQMDLSDPKTQKEEADFQGAPIKFHQYNLPYRFLDGPPARVLIAGGGMGNDAAAAVR